MSLSYYQKKILGLLIDKYERSKAYTDGIERKRAIMIKPSEVYKEYDSDYADVDTERDFERDVLELKQKKLIDIRNKGKSIQRIVLEIDSVKITYSLLGREMQKDIVQKQIALYEKWIGQYDIINKYCSHQIDLLKTGKRAKYELDIATNLLKLLNFIYSNHEMILERELSIAVFGDTKIFENEYKTKLIYVLKNYGEYSDIIADIDDDKELVQTIFEELNIYSNPKYVYFKGNAEVVFNDGTSYFLSKDIPIAFPMDKFSQIISFTIKDSNIMTIENLASYNRIKAEDCFCIYLAGYHNSAKQTIIKLLHSQNIGKKWFHFGDIDPDGFLILENLKRKTEIDFVPIYMGIEELKKYEKYTKNLQVNDVIKAKNLIEKGLYVEEIQYMLKSNIKLEQEVISWMNNTYKFD